jgi:hypothetical protein
MFLASFAAAQRQSATLNASFLRCFFLLAAENTARLLF